MAQIIVTATPVNVNVNTTRSNITVTDLETNVSVNVASLSSNVAVTNEPVNVTIAPSVGVSNAEIRNALTATAPITYDSQNGIFGFDPSANNMQVNSLTATSFIQASGGITAGGNVTGNGLVITNNATVGGTLNVANINLGGDLNANLKDISLSYFDAGNVSGNVTLNVANGPVQKIRLTNNLTGLSFTGATAAQPITLIIQQDNVGFWLLDTTTFASNWTDWLFTSNFKTLSTTANAYDYLSITYDGVKYYASLVNFFQSQITNAELANSNVIVNGVTISLGGQGNVTTGNIAESGSNQYFTTQRARDVLGVTRVYSGLSNLTYSNTTGIFTYTPVTQNDVRAQVSATSPIVYNNGTGVISLSGTANITTTGNIAGNYFIGNGSLLTGIAPTLTNAQVVSYISTVPLTVGGNLTVNGNINATGNINVQNVTDLYVRDQIIVLNANAATNANVQIISNRPTATSTSLRWNEQSTRWEFTNNGTTYFPIPTSTTDLAEGANLYYTTGRANTAIGAYQGDINTPGTITAGVSNATTLNATTVNVSGNATVLGKLNAEDGSNVKYVRAYSTELYIENTAASLPILMFGESNNRISTGDQSLRYVPATKTLFVSDGTIGTNTNNVAGNNFTISGTTTSFGNITTNATVQAGFFKGNGSQLTGIPANIAGSENITVTGNVVSLNNSLANVNSVTTTSGTNLTLNTNTSVVIRESIKGVATNVGNITGDGYGIINGVGPVGNVLIHTGTGELNSYFITTGNATANSTTITGVTLNEISSGASGSSANLNVITPYYVIGTFGTTDQYPFPPGTYVTSVDVANSTITVNNPAAISLNFAASGIGLFPGAFDSSTGLLMGLISQFVAGQGALSKTTIQGQSIHVQGAYGYPATGPVPSNFVYSVDTANDYATGTLVTNKLFARTKIEGVRTVLQAPRGLVVGNGDLTNRAENDTLPSFGINVLWDGLSNTTTEYGSQVPFTQLLLKQYSDNSSAASSAINSGPRILFTAARGNKNQSYLTTYPRINNELGRITWWGPTQGSAAPSTISTPAYINAVTNQDYITHNGGTGLYFVASPHTDAARRGMFLSHHLGNTVITSSGSTGSGATSPITFAPMTTSTVTATAGNSIAMYNNIMAANNYQWASINYDNPTAFTGSRLSITNGASTVAGRNGNISLVLDRNDNGAGFGNKEWALKLQPGSNNLVLTEDDVVRTTFSGGNITASYFIGDGSQLTNLPSASNTFNTFAVSGQSNVVADSTSDTMTFVAGSGMVITTDAATDTITFTSTGGYGNAEVAAFLAAYGSNTISTTGNITAGNTIVNGVSFNTANNVAPSRGQIVYNADYGSHQVGLNGSNVMLMGQDLVVYANNGEANTLLKGEVVYVSGATGNKATIKRAVNSSDLNSATTIGIVKSDIAAGALGYVVSQGVVDGLNLGSYTAGDKLYLGNVAGTFTNIKPQAPEHYVFIGVVEKANAGNGQILVRVQNGFELDEIHDIKLTSVQQNDILVRNSGNTLWVNQNFGTTVTNSNITLKQYQETRVNLGSTGGNIMLNMANGSIFAMTATSNISNIALSNAGVGASGTLIITQDGTGGKTLTTTSAWKFASGSKTLSTAANAIDIISFFTDGTTVYAALSKGYA